MNSVKTVEDLNNLEEGSRLKLTPNELNPLHKKPFIATFFSGYFICEGSNPIDGPDYYWNDVFIYNDLIELVE